VSPALLLHRSRARQLAPAVAASVLAAAVSLLLAHHTVLGTALRRVPGDPGDGGPGV